MASKPIQTQDSHTEINESLNESNMSKKKRRRRKKKKGKNGANQSSLTLGKSVFFDAKITNPKDIERTESSATAPNGEVSDKLGGNLVPRFIPKTYSHIDYVEENIAKEIMS